jgi:hypothetical protein
LQQVPNCGWFSGKLYPAKIAIIEKAQLEKRNANI